MHKLERVYFESEEQTGSFCSDDSFYGPLPRDSEAYITVSADDQQENDALPPLFQEIFKVTFGERAFKASKSEALKVLADKNVKAERVILNFGPYEHLDGELNEEYGPISHLWSTGCLEICILTSEDEDSEEVDILYDEGGASRNCNGQMIGLLKNMPNDFFTCEKLILSMKYMTFWMNDFGFLRAYCQKLVFERGTRNPIAAKFLEYLHKDLPVDVTPKWDSHTVCMQISANYEQFVNGLKKRFRQAHRPLRYKLILVMNYKRKYNVANFLLTNSITKERLELKQTIHHVSDDECQELFDDQSNNLAPEIPFDNIPTGYALLSQIERRSDS